MSRKNLLLLAMLAACVFGSHLNPFLQKLSERGVELLDQPSFINSKCGDQWKVKGTLCGYESLKKFALEQREKLIQNIFTYNGLILKIAPKVIKVVELILNHAPPVGECSTDPTSPGCLLERIRNVTETPYYQIFANVTARPAEYNATVNRCWNEMDKIRSNSLCGICSADSDQFFLNDKLLVSQAICEDAIQTCQQYFTDSKNFFYRLFLIDEALRQFFEPRISHEKISALRFDETSLMGHTLKASQICKAINNYTDAPTDSSLKVTATASLCEKILKIQDEPFLNTTQRFLELIQPTIELLIKQVKKLVKSETKEARRLQADSSSWTITTTSNPSTKSTEESVQNLEKIFLGDVMMVPVLHANIDSSYTSYFGANGTAGNEVSPHMNSLSINMTMLFP